MRRLHYIDTLRCVASAAVLAQHLLERTLPEASAGFLALAPGVFGVALFFYISGLVIPFSVRPGTSARSFAIRRVFRIYPAYLATLALCAVCALLGAPGYRALFGAVGLGGGLANLLFVQEYVGAQPLLGVTWTISLELVWYGLFAGIYYVLGARRLGAIANAYFVGILLASGLAVLLDQRFPAGRMCMIGAALVGYCAAEWHAHRSTGRAFAVSAGLFVLALLASQVVSFGYFPHPNISLTNALCAWIGATALFLLFASSARARESRLAELPALRFLGAISYSVYLVHGPVMSVLGEGLSGWPLLIWVPGLTVLLAWALYVWIELPGIALGKALEGRRAAQRGVPSLESRPAA